MLNVGFSCLCLIAGLGTFCGLGFNSEFGWVSFGFIMSVGLWLL